ncbi:MAG: GYD domain-containing protein [Nitrospinaceae bacterium]
MANYLILGKFTDQGIRNVKDTTKRAATFEELGKSLGVQVLEIRWLIGAYDVMSLVDAPDEQTVTALLLKAGSKGNVQTTTLRAFNKDEMGSIIQKMV